MRYLARLLYAGKIIEKVSLLYSFNKPFLRNRLDKNRQYLLDNPHELKKYLLTENAMPAEEFLARISLESKIFQGVIDEFKHEEFSYLENTLED